MIHPLVGPGEPKAAGDFVHRLALQNIKKPRREDDSIIPLVCINRIIHEGCSNKLRGKK